MSSLVFMLTMARTTFAGARGLGNMICFHNQMQFMTMKMLYFHSRVCSQALRSGSGL